MQGGKNKLLCHKITYGQSYKGRDTNNCQNSNFQITNWILLQRKAVQGKATMQYMEDFLRLLTEDISAQNNWDPNRGKPDLLKREGYCSKSMGFKSGPWKQAMFDEWKRNSVQGQLCSELEWLFLPVAGIGLLTSFANTKFITLMSSFRKQSPGSL